MKTAATKPAAAIRAAETAATTETTRETTTQYGKKVPLTHQYLKNSYI